MKFDKLFEPTNDNLDIHTKLGIVSIIAKKLEIQESEVIKMNVWGVLSALSHIAYNDSAYERLKADHEEMKETIKEVIDMLEGLK